MEISACCFCLPPIYALMQHMCRSVLPSGHHLVEFRASSISYDCGTCKTFHDPGTHWNNCLRAILKSLAMAVGERPV